MGAGGKREDTLYFSDREPHGQAFRDLGLGPVAEFTERLFEDVAEEEGDGVERLGLGLGRDTRSHVFEPCAHTGFRGAKIRPPCAE